MEGTVSMASCDMLFWICALLGLAFLTLWLATTVSGNAFVLSGYREDSADEISVSFNMSVARISNGLRSGWPVLQAQVEIKIAEQLMLLHCQKIGQPFRRYEFHLWRRRFRKQVDIHAKFGGNQRSERLSIYRLEVETLLKPRALGRRRKRLRELNARMRKGRL